MSNRAARRAAAHQASEAQLAANRANAQFSSGPKTEQGKLVSSHNALKTGLTGRTIVLPTDDVAAYQTLVALINRKFNPPTMSNNTSPRPSPIPNGVFSASPRSNPASTLSAGTNSPPIAPMNPTPNSAPPCSKLTFSAPIKRTSAISPCRSAVSAISSNRTPPNSAACKRNASNRKPPKKTLPKPASVPNGFEFSTPPTHPLCEQVPASEPAQPDQINLKTEAIAA